MSVPAPEARVAATVDVVNPIYEVLHERFLSCQGDERIEPLYTHCRWAEGPCYFPAGRYLLFSDIPEDRILRWDETTGAVGVFRQPAGYANGNTVDSSGRLLTCEQGARRVTRTEPDGSITVLAERFEGKRFNSPNDLVVKSDGSIWFTDPSYGIDSDYEGRRAKREIDGCHVYRLDPATGECAIVADDFERPNGLAFSADERKLFIADTRANHIRLFSVEDDGALAGGEVFATCSRGRFDGFRLDEQGRVWAAAGDGVHCIDAEGTLIGKLPMPNPVSNVVFGGPKRNRLFICASTTVYSIHLKVNGIAPELDGSPATPGP
jgi:gluconolactonase